jgi:ATP-dependent DNA ligase
VDHGAERGRSRAWQKTKSVAESELILVGTKLDSRSGVPVARLARREEGKLIYVGGAGFAMPRDQGELLRRRAPTDWQSASWPKSATPGGSSPNSPCASVTCGVSPCSATRWCVASPTRRNEALSTR